MGELSRGPVATLGLDANSYDSHTWIVPERVCGYSREGGALQHGQHYPESCGLLIVLSSVLDPLGFQRVVARLMDYFSR
ncbi:MAG: hypothetical protein JSU00_16580 [Acidobacteria bacterium]|nr:hypothetical protein [Acidobacteriota bacterium]